MYNIAIVPDAVKELNAVPAFYRRSIEQEIEEQLKYQPDHQTKNRKCLKGLAPEFEFEEPLWELRVGDWRVFYDIDEKISTVVIRAVRKKSKDQTTEEMV